MPNNPALNFAIGMCSGFFVSWIFYLVFLKGRMKNGLAALAKIEDYDRLKNRVSDHNKLIEELLAKTAKLKQDHQAQIEKLKVELNFARQLASKKVIAEASGLEFSEKVYAKAATPDALQKIPGIGPKFERLFWEAGVYRFSQLATLSSQQIEDIIKPEAWQKIDTHLWIQEAARHSLGE